MLHSTFALARALCAQHRGSRSSGDGQHEFFEVRLTRTRRLRARPHHARARVANDGRRRRSLRRGRGAAPFRAAPRMGLPAFADALRRPRPGRARKADRARGRGTSSVGSASATRRLCLLRAPVRRHPSRAASLPRAAWRFFDAPFDHTLAPEPPMDARPRRPPAPGGIGRKRDVGAVDQDRRVKPAIADLVRDALGVDHAPPRPAGSPASSSAWARRTPPSRSRPGAARACSGPRVIGSELGTRPPRSKSLRLRSSSTAAKLAHTELGEVTPGDGSGACRTRPRAAAAPARGWATDERESDHADAGIELHGGSGASERAAAPAGVAQPRSDAPRSQASRTSG